MRASRRLRSVLTGTLATTALVAGSLALAAAPATAAANISGWSSGYVGVPQTITITGITEGGVADGNCSASAEPFTPTINGSQQSTQTVNVVNGSATVTFIPMTTGAATWTLGSDTIGGCDLVSGPAMSISGTPTSTIVSAANTVPVNQSTVINVVVTSSGASTYSPQGTVQLNTGFGVKITSMGLTPTYNNGVRNPQAPAGAGTNSSFAFYRWTPPTTGTFTFQSVYGGDSNAQSSTSSVDTLLATPSGSTVSLNAPSTATVGVPINLAATVYPTATVAGSVGFTINGTPISASVPLVGGVANYQWTPTQPGSFTLGVNYMTNDGRSGNTSQQLVVAPGAAQTDVITLTQPGWGTWAPNGTYTLGNGTTFTFQTSTLSGAPVTLSETGPCNLNGNTFIVDIGSGQCNLVASSPGGGGLAPVKYGYTINAVPGTQTATLSIPNSGRVQLKKSIVLEGPAQGDTNAGQNIVWSVKKSSKSICKLGFPADGSVTVKLVKKGQCTVYGKAPGVPGQWNPYSITRTYRA